MLKFSSILSSWKVYGGITAFKTRQFQSSPLEGDSAPLCCFSSALWGKRTGFLLGLIVFLLPSPTKLTPQIRNLSSVTEPLLTEQIYPAIRFVFSFHS